MPGISGCTEQSTKVTAALREAHTRHRSVTVCWWDLANAYGSVHHGLIQFSLQHYNAPDKLMNIVGDLYSDLHALITTPDWTSRPIPLKMDVYQGDLYSDLHALITTPDWTSRPIPLKMGVYQGDPFSVVIFNTVMCIMADSMMGLQHLGYRFHKVSELCTYCNIMLMIPA